MSEKKVVVVVGGGYGGAQVAKILDSKFNVILIERKKTFFHSVAGVRLGVEPEKITDCYIPYDKLLKNGKVLIENVKTITKEYVILDNDQQVKFDYLVIATGANNVPFDSPLNIDNAPTHFGNIKKKIENASKILIVGGGPLGLELAGEIATDFPNKNVTLVHSREKLIYGLLTEKFYKRLHEKISNLKIDLILGERVEKNEVESPSIFKHNNIDEGYQIIRTSKGREIETDLLFWCVGVKVNNEPLLEHFNELLDETGRIQVNDFLQVGQFKNIFAIGDITNVKEIKTAYNARYHSNIVAKNINFIEGNKIEKMVKHKPTPPAVSLALGRRDGIAMFPNGWILGGFITGNLKSKHLGMNRIGGDLNNPKPYFKLNNNN
eukprot:gene4743-5920_t